MSDNITVIDCQHRLRNVVAIMATKPEFVVAKYEMLVALATVSVAISSHINWRQPGFDQRGEMLVEMY